MNKEEIKELKEGLGIDSWLELVKEDKNLNGAYISFAQYIYILEQENHQLQQRIGKAIGYINKNTVLFAELHKQGNYFINCNADKLLQILKGEDNNDNK